MLGVDAVPVAILMADLQGDRSYLLVFAASNGGPYEIYLPGAGWPGAFTGYMTPSIRDQTTGASAELPWTRAEKLGAQLLAVLHDHAIAKGGLTRAQECIQALISGARFGV
jgi:hypothetical protein